jgi:predicted MFS family arabinose efflux permease
VTANLENAMDPAGSGDAAVEAGGRLRLYSRPLLWMLAAAYACNFMDRSVVATLAQAIKLDLLLSDGQLGLLQGYAYVVLYSVAGLPIAWLAERTNRVTIISVCIAAWSGMTMVCGLAQSFGQLMLFRIGVGVGEAGCNPCSHSMIADAFAPSRRSRALSIYQLGATIGTAVGAMSAGVVAQHFGWRMAFVAVGAPGLLLALLIRLGATDPPRIEAAHGDAGAGGVRLSAVLRRLVTSPALVHLLMGFTLASFAAGALGAFTQPYFIRAFGLTYGQIGMIFGLTGGLASAASMLISGRVTDWATRRSVVWHAGIPLLGLLAALPCLWGAYNVGDWRPALAFSVTAGFCSFWFILPTLSAFHRLLGVRFVAAGMALILMFQNLLGLGTGPYLAGLLIDGVSHHLFASHGLGAFDALCPGGVAKAGAAPGIAAACHAALTQATRIGLLSTIGINLWACIHYAFAMVHVRRELAGSGG